MSEISLQQQFALKEYDALRKEIDCNRDASEKLLQYGLTVTGALWAYLLANKVYVPYSLGVPFILCAALATRNIAIIRANIRIGRYLASIEKYIGLPDELGWETLLQRKRRGSRFVDEVAAETRWFWGMLLLVQLCFILISWAQSFR